MGIKGQVEEIISALRSYGAGEADRYGFTRLDIVAARLAELPQKHDVVAQVLTGILPEATQGSELLWHGVHAVASAANLKAPEFAKQIELILDNPTTPADPRARFEALKCISILGGALSRPRLERESGLREALPGQWSDLVLETLAGAPEAMASFLTGMVVRKVLDAKYVKARLPNLYRTMPAEVFAPAMKSIISALPNADEKAQLASTIDRYYDLALSAWLRTNAAGVSAAESPNANSSRPVSLPILERSVKRAKSHALEAVA